MIKPNLTTTLSKLKKQIFDPDDIFSIKPALAAFILIALSVLILIFQEEKEPDLPLPSPTSMDIYIPKGESLVPIRVANYESLDQIIGQYGVVDLYTTPLNPLKEPRKVAYAVKLIRSAKSPRHFSVLVPAEKARRLVSYTGEFTVSVRNPKLIGTKFEKQRQKRQARRVFYESEGL